MIGNDWDTILKEEYEKEYFINIKDKVRSEYNKREIFPPADRVFYAFRMTNYKDTRVVILGQDPYHGIGEANGLCFSVNRGIKMPPSLKNIYKELYNDLGIERTDTDLSDWAKSGVLLLNSVLTVEKDKPASHKAIGWEEFTDNVIKKLNEKEEPVVFILWGNFAKGKMKYITNPNHLVISSSHPSPFSVNYGFFGSRPFSKTNDFLRKNGLKEIEW
ncbi:MAG: uracil-DNA glycosylase [Bacilli bacterium]|nr:uracil-DNA glycosylase [Bacilli bacterium]